MKTDEVEVDGFVLSGTSRIVTDNDVYKLKILYLPFKEKPDERIAYVDNGYYYLYRGDIKNTSRSERLRPGIYKNYPGKDPEYMVIPVSTDEEKEEYNVLTHAVSLNPNDVIDLTNEKGEILVAISESTKIFQPTISPNDDILKRLLKMLLLVKCVDLDQNKDQFSDKNALFNFKQVLKGDGKVSFLIFNRGCDALKIGFKIIAYELDPQHPIGKALEEDLVVDSEDSHLL